MGPEHRWVTFSVDGVEIAAITFKGLFPGEIKATIEFLASEKGIDPSKIVVGTR